MIDVLSLIQQKAGIQIDGRPTNSKDGKEYHSNCPFCGGKNRFAIWPDAGRWSCSLRSSGCGKRGDAIEFLREFENMSYREACDFLGVDSHYPEEWRKAPALPLFMTRDEPPPVKWMETAENLVWRAERYLWSGKCQNVLNYLHGRGFVDETIKKARLGYCPDWYTDSLANWGIESNQTVEGKVAAPEGIVIPWLVGGQPWKLSIRRPDKQYFQVLGSSDALYNFDSLKPDQPVMLLEGEFDALSVLQEAGDLVAPIATGGASKGLSARWIAKLIQASIILIGFDQDENLSGDQGAQEWLDVLPMAIRWEPWAHDANDMLKQGQPIRLWVEMPLRIDKAAEEMASLIVDTLIEGAAPGIGIHPSSKCEIEPPTLTPPPTFPQWPPSYYEAQQKQSQPKCQWHANKDAKQCDGSGFYCQKCWEERLFFQDAILKDAEILGFPEMLTITKGKAAWQEAVQSRGHVALGELEIVLRVQKHGLNAHISK